MPHSVRRHHTGRLKNGSNMRINMKVSTVTTTRGIWRETWETWRMEMSCWTMEMTSRCTRHTLRVVLKIGMKFYKSCKPGADNFLRQQHRNGLVLASNNIINAMKIPNATTMVHVDQVLEKMLVFEINRWVTSDELCLTRFEQHVKFFLQAFRIKFLLQDKI